MVFLAGLKNVFGTRCKGGDGPAPRLPKELEFKLALNSFVSLSTDWRPPAAKDFVLLSLQLAPLWAGVARAEAIRPWMLGWGNNSSPIILTQAQARKRNCWKWLRKQEPQKQQQAQQQDGEEEGQLEKGEEEGEEGGEEGRRTGAGMGG